MSKKAFKSKENPEKLKTSREDSILKLKKKVDVDDLKNQDKYIELQLCFETKKNTCQNLIEFMNERITKIKEKIQVNNKILSKILPYAEASKLTLDKKTEKNDEILINIFHPLLFKRKEHRNLYLIPVNQFRITCEENFNWPKIPENLEEISELEMEKMKEIRRKTGNVYIEILTNFDEMKISRIPCHKLTNSTRELEDVLEEWSSYDDSGVFEQRKTIEYLFRIYLLRLFYMLKHQLKESNPILAGKYLKNKDKIVLFKKSKILQISLVSSGKELLSDEGHYSIGVSDKFL